MTARADGGPPPRDGGERAPDAAERSRCILERELAPGDHPLVLERDGVTRDAIVHLPARDDEASPLPVVFMFHGLSSSPENEIVRTGLSGLADTEGFAVVYPRGVGASWNAGACCSPARRLGVDDVGFVRALVVELERGLCIDRERIYATGFSNGGFMTHRLACDAADLFAAAAPVSGVLGLDEPECRPARPIPIMHTHGTSDPLEPYDGNAVLGWSSVDDTVETWRRKNGCSTTARRETLSETAHCIGYLECDAGATVRLCAVEAGVHTWSHPGHDTSRAVWEFLRGHSLSVRP